ncbi:MAG: protease inhibitor I42 family protein [Planctomycetota bacterium]
MSGLLVISGCADTSAQQNSQSSDLPLVGDGPFAVNVEVSIDEFIDQNHITREIEITYPRELVVTLGSNQTTGFSWNENAIISDVDILTQIEHKVLGATGDEPEPGDEMNTVGWGAKEVWVFDSTKSGVTTLSFEYSRPWEGGENAEWTFNLVVSVK